MITAAGSIGTGLLMSKGLAIVAIPRLLVGVGSSASMSGSSAYMADLTDKAPAHRAKIMGLQGMILGSAWVAGPIVGGFLAEQYGAQNSFFVAGVGTALCSIGYSFLPETLDKTPVEAKDAVVVDKQNKANKYVIAETIDVGTSTGETEDTKEDSENGGLLGGKSIREHVSDW